MNESENESERYYMAYQRGALACLVAGAAVAVYFVAVVLGGLGGPSARGGALALIGLFVASLLAISYVTLGGRLWRRRDREAQRVLRDEWTRQRWNRACRSGFAVVMWAQLPLAFLMHRVAAVPSFAGMAGLTMTLGIVAFFATFLHAGRQYGDG